MQYVCHTYVTILVGGHVNKRVNAENQEGGGGGESSSREWKGYGWYRDALEA